MSEIKVNKISPRTACGTTTLGDSGDIFTIPAGVSITNSGTASGFGATGAVSWNTTVKTGDFTAVAGEGYFVNTTSGAINVTLPAGSAGAVVGIKDYAGTFDTSKVTLIRNGSDKIGGQAVNGTLDVEGIAVTLVFIDSTQGWLVTDSGLQSEVPTAQFITATGGTITTVCTNYKVHTFTGPGTFTVCSVGNASGSNSVDYIIVAGGGGGGGGTDRGAGGGGGGFRGSNGTASGCYAAGCAPIVGPVSAFSVAATGYPIQVGGGGPGRAAGCSTAAGTVGVNSSAFSLTAAGGGAGGGQSVGGNGGSGGGGSRCGGCAHGGGTGNTPPVTPPQGRDGGGSAGNGNGGGGGISGIGTLATPTQAGPGGQDINNSITGSPVYYAGGAGGGGQNPGTALGAASPGGSGAPGGAIGGAPPHDGGNGPDNHGGGGGGASNRTGGFPAAGGNGGSGVVIIRYKFQ